MVSFVFLTHHPVSHFKPPTSKLGPLVGRLSFSTPQSSDLDPKTKHHTEHRPFAHRPRVRSNVRGLRSSAAKLCSDGHRAAVVAPPGGPHPETPDIIRRSQGEWSTHDSCSPAKGTYGFRSTQHRLTAIWEEEG